MNSNPAYPPGRRFIAAITLGAALTPLNSTMIAVALPSIGETFQTSSSDLTLWLVTSYLLVNIILQSPAGKLGDMLGRRRAFEIGLSLFAIGALIASFAFHLWIVAFSRILMAAGGAMLIPNAMALLRNAIAPDRRSRAFGYFGAILGASAAIGPLIGGILTQNFGWKTIFLANLPILLLSWYLVHSESSATYKPENKHSKQPVFDFLGMALFAISLSSILLGLKSNGYWALVGILIGGLSLFTFIRWEKQIDYPLIDLTIFRHKPFVIGGSISGLQNLGMYALLFQLPYLLKIRYSLELPEIGLVLLTMTLFMVICSPIGGRMGEFLGTRSSVLLGLFISIVGLILLLLTTGQAPIIWMYFSLALVGGGIGIVSGLSQAAALSAIDHKQSGVASGILSTMRYLGGIVGIAIISIILTDTDPVGLLNQSQLCFQIYIGVYVFAFLISIGLPGRIETSDQ
ncbi:MAG: EmrB/QacA subfamily drug resistance transporter [Gammaproteobacteria bacterium]